MGFSYFFFMFYAAALALAAVVGVPQPVSMPPLPETPALLRIVPGDCICAVTWSGAAKADPRSTNQTEQLCAEPEVRASIAALRAAVQNALSRLGAAGGIAQRSFEFACEALQRPGCAFLRSIARQPTRQLEGGIAFQLGDDTRTARALLDLLSLAMRSMANSRDLHEDIEVDDVRFRALPTDAEHPFFGWAETDGWLLIAIGTEVPALMLHGLQDQQKGLAGNADFQRLAAATAVARPATRTFVDCARVLAALHEIGGDRVLAIADALGVRHATFAAATTGLDGDGFRSRIQLDVTQPTGLLAACAGAPIGQDALLAVPADADVAVALRVDPQHVEQALLALATAAFGSDLGLEYESFQREFADHLGVQWRRDLLLQIDGQITAWNAPSQGGLGFTAATAMLGLRDGKAFAEPFGRLMQKVADGVPSKADAQQGGRRLGRGGAYLETFDHRDHTVHWLDCADDDFPFAFSWTAGQGAALMGLTPQAVRATLDATDVPNPDQSLVRWPNVNRRGKATAMLHLDGKALLAETYPLLTMLMQTTAHEWQRDGFDFDMADVPRLGALLPHLGRELTVLEPNAHGFACTRSGSLPVVDPLTIAAVAVVTGLLAR